MGGIAQTFSSVSRRLTGLNDKFGINTPVAGGGKIGPLGFSGPRTRARVALDETFGVPPSPGDPGFIDTTPVVPTPVTPMPVPGQDDLANIAARRRSIDEQLRRRGRVSTVLSSPQSEPLGG